MRSCWPWITGTIITIWSAMTAVISGLAACTTPVICVPPPPPAASCIAFVATADPATVALTITAACRILDDEVEITESRTGATGQVTTDAAGAPQTAPLFVVAQGDMFSLRFGADGCARSMCAQFEAIGPAVECVAP